MSSVKIYIAPVAKKDFQTGVLTYEEEREITRFVIDNGISRLRKQIERDDGELGNFDYDEVSISIFNGDGRFNNHFPFDNGNSIFKSNLGRDKAKVRIEAIIDGITWEVFTGLCNEELSQQSPRSNVVELTFISLLSELKALPITGGVISNNINASTAIKNILKRPAIASIVNYDEANINVKNDFAIDASQFFAPLDSQEALSNLLLATNSIAYIDENRNIIVSSRQSTSLPNIINYVIWQGQQVQWQGQDVVFQSATEITLDNDDIISINDWSDGTDKVFNQVAIGGQVGRSSASIAEYGIRKTEFADFAEFITDNNKRLQVASNIANEFARKKHRFYLTIPMFKAIGVELMTRVKVEYKNYIVPNDRDTLARYTGFRYDDDVRYNTAVNGFSIRLADYKIIGIELDLNNFTTELQLEVI